MYSCVAPTADWNMTEEPLLKVVPTLSQTENQHPAHKEKILSGETPPRPPRFLGERSICCSLNIVIEAVMSASIRTL